MNSRRKVRALALVLLGLLAACFGKAGNRACAGGVTLITHGFDSNVTDWIIPMANKIPWYPSFPGTNVASYEISITKTGSVYYITPTFLDGTSPLTSDSGELTVALDWSTLSSGSVATTVISTQAVTALLSTNFISDLNGHALAELPLHFVGHSRGASVIAEMARLLGAQGVWVDQVTTLDPYPESLFHDPPMTNYANVLFADNYWQDIGGFLVPTGQPLSGAYNRQLTNLDNGYSSPHSDVHLWYHGTIDLQTPTTDTQAGITSSQRTNWWTAIEEAGTNTGFLYSLIGEGNRLSSLEPDGVGNGRINDGMNRFWDLGAGLASTNRSRLPADNASWPNLLRLDLTGSTNLLVGQPIPLAFYYQFGTNAAASASVRFYLDPDHNPYDTNELLIAQQTLTGTGTNAVGFATLNASPAPGILPGAYFVFGKITMGTRTRYLYASEPLVLTSAQPPVLSGAQFLENQFQATVSGLPGQTILIQASTDFVQWTALQTNILGAGGSAPFSDPASAVLTKRFYRAVLIQ